MNTKEKDRGHIFFSKFKMLQLLSRQGQKTIHTKNSLASLFFNQEKTSNTQRRYVSRIMDILQKIGLVYHCDEKGKEIPLCIVSYSIRRWRLHKDYKKKLGL